MKIYYVYDFAGEYYFSGNVKTIAHKLRAKNAEINTAIRRESLLYGKFYILNTSEFYLPIKKANNNPIFQSDQFIYQYYNRRKKAKADLPQELTIKFLLAIVLSNIENDVFKTRIPIIFKTDILLILHEEMKHICKKMYEGGINIDQKIYRDDIRNLIDIDLDKMKIKYKY